MPADKLQLQNALHKSYDRVLFSKEVLSPIFGSNFILSSSLVTANTLPNKSESEVIEKVWIYGNIQLEDGTEISCYEILLKPKVRLEHNRVAIQHYIRKLLTSGQAALINFITPNNNNLWRLTLVAKDSELTEQGVKEKTTNAKRYTFLLGPSETCKTAAERFESLSIEKFIDFSALVKAFSVEKLSKEFFDEYKVHYLRFVDFLINSSFKRSVFKKDEKAIRDFTKKLLGRIVFLYFVQKKGWLGASNTEYKDGSTDFIMQLFTSSGADDNFYSLWLTKLFFDTLNNERKDDNFELPDGKNVKIPFLNGGLFEKEEFDNFLISFSSKLFQNHDYEDEPNKRGFLDFLNAFNFTVYEDSPDEHTVAVDPEMLGHIFENLLEDNKDKGAYYTPKEIVHYMCQVSLIEYLTTRLNKEFKIFIPIGENQIEIFGNESRRGQLKILEELGDKTLNKNEVVNIIKNKDIDKLTKEQLIRIDQLLNSVKICDPAIGSGAFPMGLLQEIFSIKELISYELKTEWKPAEVKLNIIQNSIYGVDIEKGAVDIARLRFWLSLIVDEYKPKPLPNLDYKIVVGNSLVSKYDDEVVEIDWERKGSTGKAENYLENIHKLLKIVAEKQKHYFSLKTKNKDTYELEIRNLKIDILVNQLSFNKEIFNSRSVYKDSFFVSDQDNNYNFGLELRKSFFNSTISKLQNLKNNNNLYFTHFDWMLDFPDIMNPSLVNNDENIGFDIIIANPPYLKERGNAHIFRDVNNSNFGKLWHQGKMDYWYYFLHKAINISKTNSIISFITSRYWLNSQGAKKLINRISENLSFLNVVDIGKLKVFDNVVGHHMIHIYKKGIVEYFLYKKLYNDIKFINEETKSENIELKELKNKNVFINNEINFNENLLKISGKNIPLGNIYEVSQGVVEAPDKISSKLLKEKPNSEINVGSGVFVLTEKEVNKLNLSGSELNILKPYIDPNDVEKYKIYVFNKKYLIYSDKKTKKLIKTKASFVNIKKHLDYYKNYITSSNAPYGIHRARKQKFFENPKIIFKGMFIEPEFSYDDKKYYFGFSFCSIINKNRNYSLKYLLAILNSKFAKYWFYQNGKMRGIGVDIGVKKLRTFPIVLSESQELFNKFVDYIIFLKSKKTLNSNEMLLLTHFEQIINGIVYELYFPDLLKKHNREIIKHLGELPKMTDEMTDEQKMKMIKKVFTRLNEKEHPVRINLFYMNSIPEIKIIEGKNENN